MGQVTISWKRVTESAKNEFCTEASDIGFGPGGVVPNPIVLEMPNGQPIKFWHITTVRSCGPDDHEIQAWEYKPHPRHGRMTLTVFND